MDVCLLGVLCVLR